MWKNRSKKQTNDAWEIMCKWHERRRRVTEGTKVINTQHASWCPKFIDTWVFWWLMSRVYHLVRCVEWTGLKIFFFRVTLAWFFSHNESYFLCETTSAEYARYPEDEAGGGRVRYHFYRLSTGTPAVSSPILVASGSTTLRAIREAVFSVTNLEPNVRESYGTGFTPHTVRRLGTGNVLDSTPRAPTRDQLRLVA